jgi:transcription elongation factor Elf1
MSSTSTSRPLRNTQKKYEVEYNCTECFFQGSSKNELSKHINIKHRIEDTSMDGSIKCRNCGESFSTKSDLMKHRKDKHLITVAYCKNNLKGTCYYSTKMCWWNHSDPDKDADRGENGIKCFICDQNFQSKSSMMIHRKKEHKNIVRNCNLFPENKCRFEEEACWYRHGEVDEEDVTEKPAASVFHKVQENLEPPIENSEKKKNQQKEHTAEN